MQAGYEIAQNFKEFIVKNGVVSTAAAITIGFATATLVKSIVSDVIMPVIFLLLVRGVGRLNRNVGGFFAQFLATKHFRFTNFVSEAITWVLIVMAAFLVLDLVVRKTLGNAVTSPAPQNVFSPAQPAVAIPAVVTVPMSGGNVSPSAGNAAVVTTPVVAPMGMPSSGVKEEYGPAPSSWGSPLY